MDQEDLVDHLMPGWKQELVFLIMLAAFILATIAAFLVLGWRRLTRQDACEF